MNRLASLSAFGIAASALGPVAAAIPEKFNPAEYAKPGVCAGPYTFVASTGQCVANAEAIKALGEAECKAVGTFKAGTPSVCTADPAKAPKAACKAIPGYAAKTNEAGGCDYERTIPSSASGDYIGDCFHVKTVPAGTGLTADATYFVSGQRNIDPDDDRELTLVPGKIQLFPLGCKAQVGAQATVTASQLIQAGASRQGYSYGFLTMPYKYFRSERSFLVGAPIGGYLGWRYGQAGSGTTVAVALTLGSVKAETVDPNKLDADNKPTVTGTTDVPALSAAVGVMFDVLKSPRGKPFKAGIFFGRDTVNDDKTIRYRFNRKNWFAVQLGYDFTDN